MAKKRQYVVFAVMGADHRAHISAFNGGTYCGIRAVYGPVPNRHPVCINCGELFIKHQKRMTKNA